MSTEELWEELALDGEPGADVWSQDPAQELRPRFNIAPSQAVPVVTDKSPTKLTLLKWGLVPFWAKDPKIGHRMINARAEGVTDKPAFRRAFEKRRCLVLADGFYEWKTETGDTASRASETSKRSKKPKPKKTPMYVHFPGGGLMTFAGLWSVWRDPRAEGEDGDAPTSRIVSCTIITTDAAQGIRDFHDRMPVIIPREARAQWLDREAESGALTALLHPFTGAPLEIFPVSPAVGSPANDGEALIVRVADDDAPLLSSD